MYRSLRNVNKTKLWSLCLSKYHTLIYKASSGFFQKGDGQVCKQYFYENFTFCYCGNSFRA